MSSKKWLLALFLIGASVAIQADTKQAPPVPTEQAAPAEQPPSKASPMEHTAEEQAPPPLPTSSEMTTSYEGAFIRMLVTLLGLVALVFATFWILRRMGKGKFSLGSGRSINILEKRALSPKTMLYLVEMENKKVLISESQLEVRALTSLEEVPEVNE